MTYDNLSNYTENMCCRYYYEDFEIELRELMKAERVVELPDFRYRETGVRDIRPSQSGVVLHNAGRSGEALLSGMDRPWMRLLLKDVL